MAPGLLRPLGAPANPTSPRAQRAAQSARRGEPQPRSTATSLDLGAQAPRATEAAPSPDRSWPFSHSNFPPRALGAFPAWKSTALPRQKARGGRRAAWRPVAAVRASPQPWVTLKAPSRVQRAAAGASWLTPLGGRRELGAGRGSRPAPAPRELGGDPDSQLPVLALGQPPGCTVLAPGLRPDGGARAGASRPVSAWLSTEVSWWPEPQTGLQPLGAPRPPKPELPSSAGDDS